MESQISFKWLEDYLRIAIKYSRYPTSTIAKEVGIARSGVYAFMNGDNHISIINGDKILSYLNKNDKEALEIAEATMSLK